MKRYFAGVAISLFLTLAGCGGNNATCGGVGQACCTNNSCSAAGTTCQMGVCKMQATCGDTGMSCCNGMCNKMTDTCTNGVCTAMSNNCGMIGQACCTPNMTCTVGMCVNGSCAMGGTGQTGDPCKTKDDCAGTSVMCVTKDAGGNMYMDGYCSAKCNPTKNTGDGQGGSTNSACPGQGTCVGQGTTGQCYLEGCSMGTCRTGYSCFNFPEGPVCFPSSASECNPVKMDCPQDGGAFTTVDDAGTMVYSGRVCAQIGQDPVGQCVNGCDVFLENCMNGEGCFVSPNAMSPDASCISASGGADGTQCQYLNSCDPGLECHVEGNVGVCRHYCGGPMMVACPQGQTCKDLGANVKMNVIGICSK
jgi:hypothetical protein